MASHEPKRNLHYGKSLTFLGLRVNTSQARFFRFRHLLLKVFSGFSILRKNSQHSLPIPSPSTPIPTPGSCPSFVQCRCSFRTSILSSWSLDFFFSSSTLRQIQPLILPYFFLGFLKTLNFSLQTRFYHLNQKQVGQVVLKFLSCLCISICGRDDFPFPPGPGDTETIL